MARLTASSTPLGAETFTPPCPAAGASSAARNAAPGGGGGVWILAGEVVGAARGEKGLDLDEGGSRRNVVTEGVDLLALIGRRFRIGTALFRGERPCEPCGYLERRVGQGLMTALK